MDTDSNQLSHPDGDLSLDLSHGDVMTEASDCSMKTQCPDLVFEVSNDMPKDNAIAKSFLDDQPKNNDSQLSGKIPEIIIHSPDGQTHEPKEFQKDSKQLDLDLSSKSMTPNSDVDLDLDPNRDSITEDSDSQSKSSSHYLTPPTSNISTPTARPPNNNALSPDSEGSVANDEDIQVICRCSSTPVSVAKNLNDTDCSMSTVDDASPISQSDLTKANVSSNRCAVASEEMDKPKIEIKESVEQDVMFVQQQNIQTRPKEEGVYHNSNPDPKPALAVGPFNKEHDFHVSPYQQDIVNQSLGMYQGLNNDFPSYMHSQSGYTEYYPNGQRSWTDVRGRFDRPYVSYPVHGDPCCFSPNTETPSNNRMCFVYPSIYVSSAGLIAVLLRNDMSVEMTVDRTIRVVSHNHMMAVATDSKGTSACLYHPAVKVFQMGYATDISTDSFRARMDNGDAILFSNGANYFKLQDSELQPIAPIKFSDINRDQSVNLLFSSEGYGESLVATCMQVASQAEYANLPKGGVIVRINGVKVTQSGCGDVTVVTGAKFIRLSPHNGTTRLGNRFLDIEVERDWSVKLTRGCHSFISNKKQVMVYNGKMEAGFDENNVLKVVNLQARYPLLNDPSTIIRRPGRKIIRTAQSTQSANSTPKRRFPIQGAARGGASC